MKRVIVIGGGAVGLCSAHFLRASGCDVTIIERGEIGEGASLHNAGLIVPSHFVPLAAPGMVMLGLRWMLSPDSPFYIRPRLDPDLLSWLWQFARASAAGRIGRATILLRDMSFASLALYEELSAMRGMEFEFRKNGLLMLFRTGHGRDSSVEMASQASKIGIEANVLDRRQIEALEPGVKFNATGGVHYPGDAHLTPALFVDRLRECLIAQGVRFVGSARVTGFVTRPLGITAVTTTGGTFAADEFVLSGGAWSPLIVRSLRLPIPMQPGKGYSVTVRNPPVLPGMPMLLEEARVAVTPMGGRLRFSGTMELAGFDSSVNIRRVRALLGAVPPYIGGLDPAQIQQGEIWAGLRPCTPDGLPYVGRFRRFDNLIAATGHAMVGISLAPITGKLVAEIVHGRIPSIDLHLLRPDRYA
ncbi:MAG TPA: FAD-dependent oxidoreductase [Bacteroidota bacterium]|nr:FAD-dependent oxidoreductase [Bacteroidota bacterium]